MSRHYRLAALFLVASFVVPSFGADRSPDGIEFFENRIRPVLVDQCYECHSSATGKPKGGLRLDSRNFVRRGGETGPAVVPGQVSESLLISALRHESLEMPPDKKLSPEVVEDFRVWIEMGAPDPRDGIPPPVDSSRVWQTVLKERKEWWSLQPVGRPEVPSVAQESWSQNPIDRFLLASLEKEGLQPATPASTTTLLRRLALVLTGLPPDPAEVNSVVTSAFPQRVYERYVDRLLSSPHFGERWARHWMDVVGFAETHGHEWNFELRDAWRFRDYLIRAFNDDVPFDQLIREHIAGDLLQQPRLNLYDAVNESLIGTTFLRFGEIDHDDCRLFPAINLDVIDHQIDVLSKAFQATTVACARCHDHKLDAISMTDYYALSGVLASSRNVIHTINLPHRNETTKAKLEKLRGRIREELTSLWQSDLLRASEYLLAANSANAGGNAEGSNEAPLAQNLPRLAKWMEMLRVAQERAAENDGNLEIDEVEVAWHTLAGNGRASGFEECWHALRSQFQSERRKRINWNDTNFEILADFRFEMNSDWQANGLAIDEGVSRSGSLSISDAKAETIVRSILPSGFHSHGVSPRLNASLGSPNLPKTARYISFEVLGGGGGVWRHVFNNCAIQNAVSEQLKSNTFHWQRVPTLSEDVGVRSVIEFATKFDDQAFPYLNHNNIVDPHDHSSYFGVGRVVAHDCEESPSNELDYLAPLFDEPTVRSLDDLAQQYGKVLRTAVDNWGQQRATDGDVHLINWMLRHELLTNQRSVTASLANLTDEYRFFEAQLEPARTIAGVAEFESGFDVRRRIRGDAFSPAGIVPRGYVQVLSVSNVGNGVSNNRSGRLELADHIASEHNPLTARVYVNRVWQHVFGEGLVRTPDDFGQMGELPSHPQLLDFLAQGFVEHGWSTKRLIRLLVTSQAFQMSSKPSRPAVTRDPDNRLLHHYPVRRLEAEAIRDSILMVSGELDRQLFGRSIHPHRFDERPMRRLFSGPLDGRGRRSVYQKITLTEEPPFLAAFNFPDPKVTKGKRDITNVPGQALTLLNDPLVSHMAERWAERILSHPNRSVDGLLTHMFRAAFARSPSDLERDRLHGAIRQFATLHSVPGEDLLESQAVWSDIAHTFFNMKEFIFVR